MKGIPYKDTRAMPGSELYKHLMASDAKAAEKCYHETNKREKELMQAIDNRMKVTSNLTGS